MKGRNTSERPTALDAAHAGLRELAKQGRITPAAVLTRPELAALASASHDPGTAATEVAEAIVRAIAQAPDGAALRALFGLDVSAASQKLRDRRAAAAEIVGITPESFRVRREARLIDQLARALLIELAYPSYNAYGPTEIDAAAEQDPSTDGPDEVGRAIYDAVAQLNKHEHPLTIGLWDNHTTGNLGHVMRELKNTGGGRRIADGYQYVGSYPAHMWRVATADQQYETLSYGIQTFWKRWQYLRRSIDCPFHYVSLGPGTGEKDNAILTHLQSRIRWSSKPIAYMPVDISPDLLKMSLDTSMRDIDRSKVDVVPVEMDISRTGTIETLGHLLSALPSNSGILLSLLGNTLANLDADTNTIARIASMLRPSQDLFLVELATTDSTDASSAKRAELEYQGSLSFRNFVMAALSQYTDCTSASGEVIPECRVIGDTLEITTFFRTNRDLRITFIDGEEVTLKNGERIGLYTSRKYMQAALDVLFVDFDEVGRCATPYADRGGGFGLATLLLRPRATFPTSSGVA